LVKDARLVNQELVMLGLVPSIHAFVSAALAAATSGLRR
jgi:hypothetical protein